MSTYTFTRLGNEVIITSPGKADVVVTYCTTHFEVSTVRPQANVAWIQEQLTFGLYDYNSLVVKISELMFKDWAPPPRTTNAPIFAITNWSREKGQKRIAALFKEHWQYYVYGTTPYHIREVQRKVYAACLNKVATSVLMRPELYDDVYVCKDIIQYRAAAVAFGQLPQVVRFTNHDHDPDWSSDDVTTQLLMSTIRNWRGIYSYTGKPYRALDRTLAQLPGGIPARILLNLRFVKLTKPVVNRTLLLFLAALVDVKDLKNIEYGSPTINTFWLEQQHIVDLICNATEKEIKDAIIRLCAINDYKVENFRKYKPFLVAATQLNTRLNNARTFKELIDVATTREITDLHTARFKVAQLKKIIPNSTKLPVIIRGLDEIDGIIPITTARTIYDEAIKNNSLSILNGIQLAAKGQAMYVRVNFNGQSVVADCRPTNAYRDYSMTLMGQADNTEELKNRPEYLMLLNKLSDEDSFVG